MANRNCLSHWFPRLQEAGLPVPHTTIVRTTVSLTPILDGVLTPSMELFIHTLKHAAEVKAKAYGWPVFLRTGQGSGKHEWSRTCCLKSAADVPQHVFNLVEWSEVADMLGHPTDVWAVREMLPVDPLAILEGNRGMPLVQEYRGFVKEGRVVCVHGYWPEAAILQGCGVEFSPGLLEEAKPVPPAPAILEEMAKPAPPAAVSLIGLVAKAFADDGAWSVDVLKTRRGYYVTDMAEAHRSFHWEGCEHAQALNGVE